MYANANAEYFLMVIFMDIAVKFKSEIASYRWYSFFHHQAEQIESVSEGTNHSRTSGELGTVQSVCDEYSTVMWAAYPLRHRDEIPVRPPERACLTIPRTV